MAVDDEAKFARNLAARRQELGLSQSALARRMVDAGWTNYSQMTVSRTEKGERPIPLGEARDLSRILVTPLERMVGEEGRSQLARDLKDATENIFLAVRDIRNAIFRLREAWRRADALADEYDEHRPLPNEHDDTEARVMASGVRMMRRDLDGVIESVDGMLDEDRAITPDVMGAVMPGLQDDSSQADDGHGK